MTYFDRFEAEGRCECGRALRRHPPLPRPEPLASWHALRSATDDATKQRKPNAAMIASHERYGKLRGNR